MQLVCLLVVAFLALAQSGWDRCKPSIPSMTDCQYKCNSEDTPSFDKTCCQFCPPIPRMRKPLCLSWCSQNHEKWHWDCAKTCIDIGIPDCKGGRCE